MTQESKILRLRQVIYQMQAMHLSATGVPNPRLKAMLDTSVPVSTETFRHLISDAYDSPRNKIFSSHAGDKVDDGDYAAFNRRYTSLFSEAFSLARELGLLPESNGA